jgi:hypothetical protein
VASQEGLSSMESVRQLDERSGRGLLEALSGELSGGSKGNREIVSVRIASVRERDRTRTSQMQVQNVTATIIHSIVASICTNTISSFVRIGWILH